MAFYVRNYSFAPKWYFTVGTLLLCALFIRLGFWQLDRAAFKEHLQQLFIERLHLAPQPLAELPKDRDLRYYPAIITGHYDNLHTFLLDNKIHDHHVGYEVLTPFMLEKNAQAVLINRGWIPADTDRHILPMIPAVTGQQTLVGHVYLTPGKSFILGNVLEAKTTWPLRMQAVDIPAVQAKLQRSFYPFVLLLSATEKEGFIRDWQPTTTLSADKHKGYAVQWFAFTGVLMIIFLVLNIKRKQV